MQDHSTAYVCRGVRAHDFACLSRTTIGGGGGTHGFIWQVDGLPRVPCMAALLLLTCDTVGPCRNSSGASYPVKVVGVGTWALRGCPRELTADTTGRSGISGMSTALYTVSSSKVRVSWYVEC